MVKNNIDSLMNISIIIIFNINGIITFYLCFSFHNNVLTCSFNKKIYHCYIHLVFLKYVL